MKNIISLLILFVVCASFIHRDSSEYGYYPIFMARNHLDNSVSYLTEGRELVNPGKIYYKAPYIYVNERYKGVHVINNSNPLNPVHEGFILAPGCIDMAAKGDVLYIDNSVDLVTFNLTTKLVTNRVKNIFPEPSPPDNKYYYFNNRPDDLVLVGWEKKTQSSIK